MGYSLKQLYSQRNTINNNIDELKADKEYLQDKLKQIMYVTSGGSDLLPLINSQIKSDSTLFTSEKFWKGQTFNDFSHNGEKSLKSEESYKDFIFTNAANAIRKKINKIDEEIDDERSSKKNINKKIYALVHA